MEAYDSKIPFNFDTCNYMLCLSAFLMQPLMDNLEAQTYETFEKDAVKYIQVHSPFVAWLEVLFL